jgi:hypothetical protein
MLVLINDIFSFYSQKETDIFFFKKNKAKEYLMG